MGINTTVQPSVGMDSNLLILCALASNLPADFTTVKVSDLANAKASTSPMRSPPTASRKA